MSSFEKRKIINGVEISKKITKMNEALQGFWTNDKWDVRACPLPSAIELCQYPALRIRYVYFTKVKNPWVKVELKYFFYYHMINDIWKAKTVWIRKGTVIGRMFEFLDLKYPNISSITEIPIERALMEYRTYLVEQGIKTTVTNHKIMANQEKTQRKANSYYITCLKQFMEFYEDYYFDGEEWDKDVWDVRKLNISSEKINPTSTEYTISYKEFIDPYFKEFVKRYCKLKMNTLSFSTVNNIAQVLKEFFNFLNKKHPQILRLNQLSRKEIEDYLAEINLMGLSARTVNARISSIEGFFTCAQRFEWDDAPSKILIYPEDYPKESKAQPRFIDEYVLEQLNSHLDKLQPFMATMVMVIQECGMRISELCTLKRNCLMKDQEGDYFLKTYQRKMKKEHTVPISREVAALIKNQEQHIIDTFGKECEYVFPRKDGSPLKQSTFRENLNRLAHEENITGRDGKLFRFHSHAFRHTVGTRMINNGVPQHIVQKFLGHESPEMTSRYAHIYDETLKKEFSKFKEKLITNNGSIIEISNEISEADDTDLQWFKKNINAQALPNGYCRLPVISGPCPHANACLDCTHFCTSKQFLGEHEEHLNRTKQLLDRAKQNQWQRQVETNERVKDRLEQIIHMLKESEQIG